MAQDLIISISGLRGLVGENLDDKIAADYGRAFGGYLRERFCGNDSIRICIGRDTRPTGEMLCEAVTLGLTDMGIDVVDLGVVTTPCVGIMVRQLGCQGGVVVTASHNPLPYNGIKLLMDNGIAPPVDEAVKIKQAFSEKTFANEDVSSKGTVTQNEKTDDFHLERIYAILEKDRIASKKYKVVIDHINGAGCRITQRMLAELGCDVIGVNNEPSGQFAHTPEPTARNLSELSKIVKDNHADIGFAQDPDADRLAIVDEHGRYIGEEYTLALAAKYIFSHNKGTAAANLSTSRMIDDIAVEYGCQVIRTPVGEANVADAMIQNHCVIGGEGNGGIIDLRVGPVRDSLVGIALVLQFMAETGKSISELVSEIPAYCMIKEKFTADKNMAERIIENAKEVFTDAAINTSDGCRFDLTDSWVHLRTSNTEPVMRAIVEAPDENTANELIEKIMAIRDFI